MAFVVPVFPIFCDIFDATAPPPGPARLTSPCNLSQGRRVLLNVLVDSTNADVFGLSILLLPALTDIRGRETMGPGIDWVEVPAGSGRIYGVFRVDDMGKGFANEHRFAAIAPVPSLFPWPAPIP